ncbi:MAG: glycoside hydrolase family 2 protein [Betaproteobacteria bacterium]
MTPTAADSPKHGKSLHLGEGWQLASTPAGQCARPEIAFCAITHWHPAQVPGTVAGSIHGDLNIAGNYDADDWWYRLDFNLVEKLPLARYQLDFGGLATIADVWLNGEAILSSRNMFISHRVNATALKLGKNELVICFRSLNAELATRRPRPRWKTRLVDQQNLRWFRTTLLGRIPGWTPPITPVGPWRPITLVCVQHVDVKAFQFVTKCEGTRGTVEIQATLSMLEGCRVDGARLRIGGRLCELNTVQIGGLTIMGVVQVPDAPLWWPLTHGAPSLVPWALEISINNEWIEFKSGLAGFKQIQVDQQDGQVIFSVNGVRVFCCGACWTTMDILRFDSDPAALRRALEDARDAGVNMLRVGGTMVYESTLFYELCDELGILVWQDFMFANMDYPVGDTAFREEIDHEVRHQLNRLQRHACIAAYCGGSEIAQQAAMLGLPSAEWTNDFYARDLPALCTELHPGIPYFPSTPWGGALPFHVATGISHYYGVGAYKRPLSDARAAGVKFASECLGFSNLPDPETAALLMDGTIPPPHHPRWKSRVPRDNGAGWDFEDIRDHYLELLFGIDAIELRSQDPERYYAVSAVVTGEVMQHVFSEWRRDGSQCGGALVWFYRDLWPGAGWGITDSTGRPKAAYWYLKRAWATRAVRITDEGLDGLNIHVINEPARPLEATVELCMLQYGKQVASATPAQVTIAPRQTIALQADALLGYFSDSTSAYRFGPAKFDVVTARLRETSSGKILSEDFFFPGGLALPMQHDAVIDAQGTWNADGSVSVALKSNVFLQSVSVACSGYEPDDNYFHLGPDVEKRCLFRPVLQSAKKFRAHYSALNALATVTVRVEPPPSITEMQ